MSQAPKNWMPRDQWDALVRGEGCPLCKTLRANNDDDQYGFTIADLAVSRLRLSAS